MSCRWLIACLLICMAQVAGAQTPHVVQTAPLAPAEQQKKFKLPPGFAIELVAAEPQIAKPINMAFDARGRLLVTNSLEYPYAAKAGTEPRDAVTVLEDRDGNGTYEHAEKLIDQLNIPIGITPGPSGEVIVYSIPHIYRIRDTNGDGRLDARETLLGPFGYDDTHGMNNGFVRWIDGWIYAAHGFRNTSTVQGQDGHKIEMNSGNTYRFRPDGSRIEYFTHGQVNPFGLAMDPLGNLYSADCHTLPGYQLLRGAYYPSFGKPDDGLGFGPVLMTHNHGSTAIGGVVYYAADHFPPEYRDTLFLGNPVTNRVNHDRLEPHGASYKGIEQPDFLSCDDPWFRPVDLKLGPDGALYVADFYNCIIGHYEVPLDHPQRDRERGRIWRIVYQGTAEKPARPAKMRDLTRASLAELWEALGDANLTVRTLATNELVDRFAAEVPAKLPALVGGSASTAAQRAHGLWAIERTSGVSDELARKLAGDADRLVRVHALRMLAERADWKQTSWDVAALVREKLTDGDSFVRLVAADALARHPALDNVAPLLELWRSTQADDTHLIHVVRMALRDQVATPEISGQLAGKFSASPDDLRRLLEVSLGAATPEAALFVLAAIERQPPETARSHQHLKYLARHLPEERLGALAGVVSRDEKKLGEQVAQLKACQQGCQERGKPLPEDLHKYASDLALKLIGGEYAEGFQLAKELKLASTLPELHKAIAVRERRQIVRLTAMETAVAIDAGRSVAVLADRLADGGEADAVRQKAAETLAAVNSDASRAALVKALPLAGYQLAVPIAAGLAGTRPGAESLLALIQDGKAAPQLLQEAKVVEKLKQSGVPELDQQLARLTAGLQPADEALQQLIAQRRESFLKTPGEASAGQKVFEKHCAVCHQVGGQGKKIGPQLDGIGIRGLDRVLEDTMDPSRIVDPAFRSVTLLLDDGRILSGVVLREEGEVIVLADSKGQEHRVERKQVEEHNPSPLSLMPTDIARQLSDEEFRHLLAWLLAQKQPGTAE